MRGVLHEGSNLLPFGGRRGSSLLPLWGGVANMPEKVGCGEGVISFAGFFAECAGG